MPLFSFRQFLIAREAEKPRTTLVARERKN
jgi:hypothetical protein